MGRTVRLNKYIAESGVTSRRKADLLISSGKVVVNGKKIFELGTQIDPETDRVFVEGKPIKAEEEKVYLMFFKPRNVMTTLEDPEGRPTVADYIQDVPYRVFPIGRLDWESEGLLLLTNDGDYANRIMHPKHEIPKTYEVKVNRALEPDEANKLRRGISIIGGKVAARELERIYRGDSKDKAWYRIVIGEGKNRQIRRMFEKVRVDVEKLQRVAIGSLELKGIARGEYVILNKKKAELALLDPIREEKLRPRRKVSTKRVLPLKS